MGDMKIYGVGAVTPQQNAVSQQKKSTEPDESPAVQQAVFTPAEQEKETTSLYEMMQEAREKAEEHKKRLQLPKSSIRYGDAPMQAYARLAKARNRMQVDAAAGYARRCIAQFKTAMRQDGENAERIKAAINQLQKAVGRAGKKKRELEREKLTDLQRARYEQNDELRRAQRLEMELRRRRTLRAIRECGFIRETEVDNRFQDQMAETRTELRAQVQMFSGTISADAAARQYTAVQASAGAECPSPEIDVLG